MKVFTLIPLVIGSILSHSWLDCIGDANQAYSGPDQYFSDEFYTHCFGFPRGYPGRMNRYINDLYTNLIELRGGPNKDAKICGSKTGASINYTSEFKMAKVKAGTKLKLWYELDNHYTVNPTYVHLWGYGVPNKEIVEYKELTDKTHIFKHVFATPENCKDIHNANSLCWGYWTVPETYKPGVYSFLWNWVWDQNPSGEEYNTCFEIEVIEGDSKPEESNKPTEINPTPTSTSTSTSTPTSTTTSTATSTLPSYTEEPVPEPKPEPYPVQPPPSPLSQNKCQQKY